MAGCHQPDGASFDLLLDTMCNMFGGMVLIAILLAVLAQASGRSKQIDDSDDGVRVDAETAARQEAEVVQLGELIAQRQRRLRSITNVVMNATSDDVEGLRKKLAKLREENADLEKSLESHRNVAEEKDSTLEQLEVEIAELEAAAAKETAKVETRNLRMPTLRVTEKMPVFLAVSKGALHTISDVTDKRRPYEKRDYDPSSVTVDHEPGGLDIVEIRAQSGQDLSDGGLPGEVGGKILANVERNTEFLWFAVYPDSYGAFNRAKEFFASRGYEFNWTRMTKNQTLSIVPAKRIETQ